MKKIMLATLMMLLVASVAYAAVDNVFEVAVINYTGDVQVDSKGDGTWIKPWVGMKLMQGAKIKTSGGAWIEVVYDAEGLNVLKLEEKTDFVVGDFGGELPGGGCLGNFANINPGSEFIVKTPTAACAIRGSTFGFFFDRIAKITRARAFRGGVFIYGLDANGNTIRGVAQFTVPQGIQVQIRAGKKVSELTYIDKPLTEAQMVAVQLWVQSIGQPWGTEVDVEAAEAEVKKQLKEIEDDIDPKDLDEEKGISPSS
ncbi:MAG: hypothetical protein P9L88_06865 [Candidatus Tantalella remota]|nr:hypothetical protein [Candidatus Tantalella remota]